MAREGKLAMDSTEESQQATEKGDSDDGSGGPDDGKRGGGIVLELNKNLMQLIARMEEREKHRNKAQMQRYVVAIRMFSLSHFVCTLLSTVCLIFLLSQLQSLP